MRRTIKVARRPLVKNVAPTIEHLPAARGRFMVVSARGVRQDLLGRYTVEQRSDLPPPSQASSADPRGQAFARFTSLEMEFPKNEGRIC